MTRIYLDNAATTPIRPEVLEAMQPFLAGVFGNPSSAHRFGREARAGVHAARRQVAAALGAEPNEIVFTSGGTEADNLAVVGAALAARAAGKPFRVAVSAVEHKAILAAAHWVAALGGEMVTLPVDGGGRLDLRALDEALARGVAVVSVMWVNNETGLVQDVGAIAERCHAAKTPFHTDAVQSFGKVPLHVRDVKIDLLSISAHKIYGPKGVGALYVRRGVRLQPLLRGGGQERGRRSGTENIPAIVGLGEAARLMCLDMSGEEQRLRQLRDRFESGVLERVGGVRVNGQRAPRLVHTSNLSFDGVEAQTLVAALDLERIAVSAGSACHVGSLQPSHVLRAMGLSREHVEGSIRFSLGRLTSDEDIDHVLEILSQVVERLRENAPVAG